MILVIAIYYLGIQMMSYLTKTRIVFLPICESKNTNFADKLKSVANSLNHPDLGTDFLQNKISKS